MNIGAFGSSVTAADNFVRTRLIGSRVLGEPACSSVSIYRPHVRRCTMLHATHMRDGARSPRMPVLHRLWSGQRRRPHDPRACRRTDTSYPNKPALIKPLDLCLPRRHDGA